MTKMSITMQALPKRISAGLKNSFKSAKGNVITEVNVGSLVGYPAPIVNITVHSDMTLSYNVDYLEKFTFDGGRVTLDRTSDYYLFVMSVISIPKNILKKNKDYEQFILAVDSILAGGNYNNRKDII